MSFHDRVFILGSGAIGLALAVHLVNQNREVILVRTSRDDVSEKKTEVSMRDVRGEIIKASMNMVSLSKLEKLNGLIVITTKSYVNKMLASKLLNKNINSPLVVMQNGLGVENPFINNDFSEIYRCILFATSQTLDENFIQYKPIAPSSIGIIKGNSHNLQKIVTLLDTPGFQFVIEENLQDKIWQKAIINSVFNSVCPLLEIDNGIFYRNEDVTRIATEIIKECLVIASASGITLTADQLLQQVLKISELSDGQFISTLQDIKNKKETEISLLNLEIARIAEKLELKTHVAKTELLGKLILLKSEIHMQKV
ncbi:MAG: 2-dehydropantoate 2-reductase [Candidatus Heimdallarchaeota archaeon]|nr:MAG: 2-dehydropantoate 2-reductase [Candidatus Heimdallarchaeota archaeon]